MGEGKAGRVRLGGHPKVGIGRARFLVYWNLRHKIKGGECKNL